MADANYVLDISASMAGGEKTISELDALTANLLGAGVGADALHDAVALATNSLTAATAATATANAAFAKGSSELKALEKAAVLAGKAQEQAAKLGVVPPEVAASVTAASAAVAEHKVKLAALGATAKAASAQEAELAKALSNVKQAASAGGKAFAEQEAAVKKAEAAQLKASKTAAELTGTGKFQKLQEAMSTTEGQALLLGKAAGIAAGAFAGLTVALAAVTLAALAGVAAITSWAIGLADAKRNADLNAQAVAALHPEVAALSSLFAELNAETGLGDAKLLALTKRLKDAGVGSVDMAGALHDAALAEKALGDGGADDFIAQIKEAKGAVSGLSNEVRGKLGVIVAKQLLGLDAQSTQLKKNIGSLFGGLDIEPALNGLKRLVGLFDQNTEAGGAMKFLFESVFQPIVSQAEKAAIVVEAFALGFLIGMTKLYINLKPVIRTVSELFGFSDTSLVDLLGSAKSAGEAIAPVVAGLAVAFGVVAAAVVGFVGALTATGAAFLAIPVAIQYAAQALGGIFGEAIKSLVAFLSSVSLSEIGGNMMQGLADGITGAAGRVISAITGAVGGAIQSAKDLLGIASPSKVFAAIGGNTAEGFAVGVDDGADAAQESLAAMVAPPSASVIELAASRGALDGPAQGPVQGGAGPDGGGPAGGAVGWSGDLILQFPNATTGPEITETVREVVLQIWEGSATQLGATQGAQAGA